MVSREVFVQVERKGVETIDPDQIALEAGEVIMENKFGCLPVVEGGDHLFGIITESDSVRHFVTLERGRF
jgi:CBS domain-containing membrane protein